MTRKRVLVVEDDTVTRTLLVSGLSDDFEVSDAGNGREAIERLNTRKFDSIVLDLMMPVVDGFGVLHFVEKNLPHLLKRIIVVTGADDHVVKLFPAEKVFGVLSKPCGVTQLAETIARCCEG